MQALVDMMRTQELCDVAFNIAQMRVLITRSLILLRVRGLATAERYPLHGFTATTTATRLSGTQSRGQKSSGNKLTSPREYAIVT